ncbi:MAG: tetratricopeptide repeat protein [Acidobacteria bacterium]|nr:tetratricopeptide repeat protein [Acidobacteriota bacterium]
MACLLFAIAFSVLAQTPAEEHYRSGVRLLRQKEMTAAERELREAARLAPAAPLVWLALAQVELAKGQLDEGLKSAARAEALAPQEANVRRALGMFHRMAARGQAPGRAVELLQKSIGYSPEVREGYLELAQLLLDHRTFEPASMVLSQATARFPADPEILRFLGLAQYGAGEHLKALDTFLRVAAMDADNDASYASLETLLPMADAARLVQIEKLLAGFVARKPGSPLGYFLLARVVTAPGEAERLLREAVKREPGFWPAWFELHRPLSERGEVKDALAALNRAVALNESYAPAHYALAQVHGRLGDRDAAMRHRRRHHELVTKEREAADARRAAAPLLPYKIDGER